MTIHVEIVQIASQGDIQALIAKFLGNPNYHGISEHMQWDDGQYIKLTVRKKKDWLPYPHATYPAKVRDRGYPVDDVEIETILEELAEQGLCPTGEILVLVDFSGEPDTPSIYDFGSIGFLSLSNLQALIGMFLVNPEEYNSLVKDVELKDGIALELNIWPEENWAKKSPQHASLVENVRQCGYPTSVEEIEAILEELAKEGRYRNGQIIVLVSLR